MPALGCSPVRVIVLPNHILLLKLWVELLYVSCPLGRRPHQWLAVSDAFLGGSAHSCCHLLSCSPQVLQGQDVYVLPLQDLHVTASRHTSEVQHAAAVLEERTGALGCHRPSQQWAKTLCHSTADMSSRRPHTGCAFRVKHYCKSELD